MTHSSPDLSAVIAGWQQKLLQLDRRNNLLYFKAGRGSVRLIGCDADELDERLLSAKRGLAFSHGERVLVRSKPEASEAQRGESPGSAEQVGEAAGEGTPAPAKADASAPEEHYEVRVLEGELETAEDVFELEERLKAIQRREREWQEEQGINVLFLAAGFLGWVDEDGQEALAPLVLLPCDLARRSPRDPFRLVRESDERVLNATLVHKLATAGIDLPALDEGKLGPWFQHLREEVLRERPGWFVEEDVALGIFSYSKLAMWQDLEDMRLSGVAHPLVRALAGGEPQAASAAEGERERERRLPPPNELTGGRLDDLLGVRDRFEVLDADHSQLRAIHLARSGANLVIHGPPGTGKSQTIANIIASQIADGRRVLFVSEKTAALDVVKRRLVECGLGVFCLDLHSERAKKTSLYRQLGEALDVARPSGQDDHEVTLARLAELRGRLNDNIRALHAEQAPLGMSVYAVCGRLAQLVQMPRIELEVPQVATLDPARIAVLEELAGRVARREALFREHATSPWRPLLVSESSVELPDKVRGDMQRVRAAASALRASMDEVARGLGLAAPSAPSSGVAWTPLLEQLTSARALPDGPGVPPEWLSHEHLAELRELHAGASERARARRERLAELERALTSRLADDGQALPFALLAEELRVEGSEADALASLLGRDWERRFVPSPAGLHESALRLREALAERERALASLSQLIAQESEAGSSPVAAPERLPELDAWIEMLKAVLELGSVPAPWLESGRIERLLPRVDEAERRLGELEAARAALSAEFSEGITGSVDHEMRVRYRTDWQSFFRRLGGAYRRDDRTLRGYLKQPRKLSVEQALALIEKVMLVKQLEDEWKLDERKIEEEFGPRFQGAATSWRKLRRDLKLTQGLLGEGSLEQTSLRRLLAGRGVSRELREAVARTTQTQAEVRARLDELVLAPAALEGWTVDELFAALETSLPILARVAAQAQCLEGRIAPQAGGLESLREACARAQQLELADRAELEQESTLASAFGARFRGFDTRWDEIGAALEWSAELLRLAGFTPGEEPDAERIRALAAEAAAPREREAYARIEEQLRAQVETYLQELAPLAQRFDEGRTPWGEWRRAPFAELIAWSSELESRAGSAADWIDYRRACAELEARLGAGLVDRMREVSDDASLIPAIVMRRIWLAWLELAFAREPALAIAAADLHGLEQDFGKLDRELPLIARQRVRARAFASYPEAHSTSLRAGQLGTLRGELSKRRMQLPIRSLVTRIPGLLQVLKPCFLMSPLSVSQYLPRAEGESRGLDFDVVVFDEASQVFPEDAVPAIARAAQVIVVGDQQQLPPTQFFRAAGAAEPEFEALESGEDATGDAQDRFAGRESILDVMVGLAGQGVAAEYLTVHYRSRHSDLIRYSNHYFYADRLFTFPGADHGDAHLGVKARYLEDGLFEAGGSRTNRREAEEIVERVFELMRARPFHESIGVVTLSRPQADLIETLIATRRRSEREFDERFALDLPERFFVKNLENVQGDERDHILLSIGYGPSEPGGTVANRFGPINQPGGERRLNVAVSRARRSMTVVHSLRPEQVTAQNEGARLLRSFLEFVRDPDQTVAELDGAAEATGAAGALLPDGVRSALELAGYEVESKVGVAGYFVDLALRAPGSVTQYDLGIEFDGPQCHATPTARDRDRLRPSVLTALGWTLYRLRASSWIRDPEGELARIEAAIQAARAAREAGPAEREPDLAVREPRLAEREPGLAEREHGQAAVSAAPEVEVPAGQMDAQAELDALESASGQEPATADDANDSAPSDPREQAALFEDYASTSLEGYEVARELAEEPPETWLALVSRIIAREGPIHRDLVFERLREHYGSPRSTPTLRGHFEKALQAGVRAETFACLPVADADEEANAFLVSAAAVDIVPRRPAPGESARNIKQVSGRELEEALLSVVEALFGASDEDALGECARQLGYQRMGPSIARRLEAARDRLLESGRLVRQFDSLTCAPTAP